MITLEPGQLMRNESSEAASVLLTNLRHTSEIIVPLPQAIYTIARGSSDAAATILNYEFMRQLGVPATTLPPSVFSLGTGVGMDGALAVAISQSGASDDLVAATKGAAERGANVIAITNVDGAPLEKYSNIRLPIGAGPELAVPATKSVVGSVAIGAVLIGSMRPSFAESLANFEQKVSVEELEKPQFDPSLAATIAHAKHIFVVGREGLLGAAQEIALKIKECCGVHAEAYSASELLHGPMQMADENLVTLILDDGSDYLQQGLDLAEARLSQAGSHVERLRLRLPAVAPQSISAAVFLVQLYPILCDAALTLGINPDAPSTLSKVTKTI